MVSVICHPFSFIPAKVWLCHHWILSSQHKSKPASVFDLKTDKVQSNKTAWINAYTVYYKIRMCPVSSNFTFITIILCFWPLWYLIISENFDISCKNFAIIFVIIKLSTQTIFKSSSLELKRSKSFRSKSNVEVRIYQKEISEFKPRKSWDRTLSSTNTHVWI